MPIRHVVCALSGGVDSAVSAFLLKQREFRVSALFMINWDHIEEGVSECTSPSDMQDADNVCKHLQIPLITVNFVKEYWNKVFLYLLDSYSLGRTIVPDATCNQFIKFELFQKFAFEQLKADSVATGHFARTNLGDFLENAHKSADRPVRLLRGMDPLKDQSFFLSTVKQENLRNVMFPVGSMIKPRVKEIAKEIGLPISEKKESMGICFIGKRKNFAHFISQYVEPKEGEIRDIDTGRFFGKHSGIHQYTIGKRLSLPSAIYQYPGGIYVSKLDPKANIIYACNSSLHPSLFVHSFTVSKLCWIENCWPEELSLPFSSTKRLLFRCQRNRPLLNCTVVRNEDSSFAVHSQNPVRAPSPGQSCVLYRNEQCLGSGEIDTVLRSVTVPNVSNL